MFNFSTNAYKKIGSVELNWNGKEFSVLIFQHITQTLNLRSSVSYAFMSLKSFFIYILFS